MGSWADFFVAELGAAAALTGLVIVGISINVTRILQDKGLPGRAIETLVLPTGILVASTYALVPHQPDWLLGIEFISTGAVMWLIPTVIHLRGRPYHDRAVPRCATHDARTLFQLAVRDQRHFAVSSQHRRALLVCVGRRRCSDRNGHQCLGLTGRNSALRMQCVN